MVTENINIDVRPGGVPIVVHVTQYEVGLRTFEFVPFTSSGEWTDVTGSATLEGTKPDGNAFQQACTYVDGIVTYVLHEQLCAVSGRVWSRLVIRNIDGDMIGMTAIVWDVGEAGVKDDAVMSDSDISALHQFLDEFGTIDAYRGALNGALAAVGGPLVAATASAMTDTTKVYVYTGSESGYTEGHWYYWNGSAWTDGGVYQSTGINTDKTLTVEDMAADAKATGDAVAELKNDLSSFDSMNNGKMPLGTLIPDKYINKETGHPNTYNGWSATNFIEIGLLDKLVITCSVASEYNCFYDASKEPLDPPDFSYSVGETTVSIPSGAKYIRLSNTTAGMGTLSIKGIIKQILDEIEGFEEETGNAIDELEDKTDEVETAIGTAIGTETAINDVSINPVRGHRYYYSNGEFKDVSDVGNTFYSDVLNVSAGQKYYYSGRVYNYQNQYSVIVTDNNSTVLLYELGNTTDTNVVDYPFTIPDNGTKLYITSYRKVSDASSSDLALKQETTNLFQISRITDEIGGVIPQYYCENNWLQNRIEDVIDNSGFMNGVVVPFITDIHFHSNAGNSKYLLKEILEKTSASFVIGGGDYQGGFGGADELTEQFNAFYDFAGYIGHDRFFPIAGNHDFYEATSADADSSTWVKATYGEVYNAIYRPYERWQVNRKAGGYCCVDNDAQKTRLVLMNSHEVSPVASSTLVDGLIRVRPEQIQWLISVLKEKSDYNIIVFSHAASDPNMPDYSVTMLNTQKVLEAFANKTSYTIQFTEQWSITADFTSTTNNLICHINGHSHVDASHVSNGVLSICTTCDACLQDDGYGATKGTVTEQAFDVFCIDYDAKTINAVRFGRGSNRSWTY